VTERKSRMTSPLAQLDACGIVVDSSTVSLFSLGCESELVDSLRADAN